MNFESQVFIESYRKLQPAKARIRRL